jgi:hypothetical protein
MPKFDLKHLTWVTLCFVCCQLPAATASDDIKLKNLDTAFRGLAASYPGTAILGGSISMVSGAFTGFGGFILSLDGSRPGDEQATGGVAMVTGAVTGVDGLVRFFGKPTATTLSEHYFNFPAGKPAQYGGLQTKLQYGEATLKELASDGKAARILRGVTDLVSAGCYLYLYGKAPTGNYNGFEFPAAALAAIGLYRILKMSPEERAWSSYREANETGGHAESPISVEFFASALPGHPVVGSIITF